MSMHLRIVLIIYNLLLPLALLLMLPGYLLKMLRRGSYGRGFGERLGIYSARTREILGNMDRPLWIHAVSVGEVNIAKKLVAALRDIDGDLSIVISTTTPTGFAIAEQSDADLAIYNPVDLWPVARRALRVIDPRALVLVEAEVWPNLVNGGRQAWSRGVPCQCPALIEVRAAIPEVPFFCGSCLFDVDQGMCPGE